MRRESNKIKLQRRRDVVISILLIFAISIVMFASLAKSYRMGYNDAVKNYYRIAE